MNANDKSLTRTLVIVSGFVFEMVALIGIGFLVGNYLDKWLNTDILFTVITMLIAVFFGIWQLIKHVGKLEDFNGKK